MKQKKAFTMAETMVVMIVLGILGACTLFALRPVNMKKDALVISGKNAYAVIHQATVGLLSKYSPNLQMTKLLTTAKVEFSINDTNADAKLSALYKKVLKSSRNSAVPADYLSLDLQDEQSQKPAGNIKVSYFTQGIKIQNGTYLAFKLFNGCDSEINYIYDPSAPQKRTLNHLCGLIFFDVNAQDSPNALGIDQYIIGIGKYGIK